jgi:hypothetical protein
VNQKIKLFSYRNTVKYDPEELDTPPIKKIERNIKLKIIPGKLSNDFLRRLEEKITGNSKISLLSDSTLN